MSATSCSARSVLTTWSNLRLAYETIAVPVDEHTVGTLANEVRSGIGGVVLFGSTAPANLGAALHALTAQAPGGYIPFVMVDEEGGAVQRMANLAGSLPSARTMSKTMTPAEIRQAGLRTGKALLANGVSMDLAPVLDVDGGNGPNASDVDGTRSFSDITATAAADGVAFAQGLMDAGVVPVVKHFPGLGGSVGNTDLAPAATVSWRTEQRIGLPPFESALHAHVPAVMVTNANVPGLTTLPASISPQVITGVLRKQLKFNGLVMTDSLSVKSLSAVGYSVEAASVAAIAAGADMVLFNATVATTKSVTNAIAAAIAHGVTAGTIARSRLLNAAQHVIAAHHLQHC